MWWKSFGREATDAIVPVFPFTLENYARHTAHSSFV